MKLGQLIKEYREKNNISMRDFEKKSGLSRSYISLLEKDESISPTLPTIQKVAVGLGITFDDLIDILDNKQNISLSDIESSYEKAILIVQKLTRKELEELQSYIERILNPTRKEIILWLNDNIKHASSSGQNYEMMTDEELRAFYEAVREEKERD